MADRRAVAFGLDQAGSHGLDARNTGTLAEVLEGHAAILQVGQLGGGEAEALDLGLEVSVGHTRLLVGPTTHVTGESLSEKTKNDAKILRSYY